MCPFVFMDTPRGPVATEVELGQNNLTHVQILSGLKEGDRVYLVEPTGVRLPVPAPQSARSTESPPSEASPGGAGQ